MRGCFVVLLSVLANGCVAGEPEADGKVPGKLLGSFSATGRIAEDDCGAELLGAEDPWQFELKLSRFQRDLYWLNGREAIVGELAADGESFHFSSGIEVVMRPPRAADPGCTVARRDVAEGRLSLSGEEVTGFEATLSYQYYAKNNSDCIEFIGITGGINTLPCEISYRLSADRADP